MTDNISGNILVKNQLNDVIDYLNSAADILYNIEGTVANENYELIESIISDLIDLIILESIASDLNNVKRFL